MYLKPVLPFLSNYTSCVIHAPTCRKCHPFLVSITLSYLVLQHCCLMLHHLLLKLLSCKTLILLLKQLLHLLRKDPMLPSHHHERLLAARIELYGTIGLDLAFSCTMAGGWGVGGGREWADSTVMGALVLSLLGKGWGSLQNMVIYVWPIKYQ